MHSCYGHGAYVQVGIHLVGACFVLPPPESRDLRSSDLALIISDLSLSSQH